VSSVTIVFYDKVRGWNKAQRWLLYVCWGFYNLKKIQSDYYYIFYKRYSIWKLSNARKDGLICGVSHCSHMHIVWTDLNICIIMIMFLLFAKLGDFFTSVEDFTIWKRYNRIHFHRTILCLTYTVLKMILIQ
jgi:hypothetical protein